MHPIRIVWLALFAVSAVFGWPLPAQDSPYRFERSEGVVSISLQDEPEMSVADFIRGAQRVTGKVFTYDDTAVAGESISFVGTVQMTDDEFLGFFQTMLHVNGFAYVVRGEGESEVLEIVRMHGPDRRSESHLPEDAEYVPAEELEAHARFGKPILTSLPLDHLEAAAAEARLRPWVRDGLRTARVGSKAAVLVQGPAEGVYRIARLLKLIDVPNQRRSIHVVALKERDAAELAESLNEFLGESRPDLKIVPHELTNSLLIAGTGPAVDEVQEVIGLLDR